MCERAGALFYFISFRGWWPVKGGKHQSASDSHLKHLEGDRTVLSAWRRSGSRRSM